MRLGVTFTAADGERVAAAEVVGVVVVDVVVILVPPGLFCREVELKLGEGVDVHEGRVGANVGRLHCDGHGVC